MLLVVVGMRAEAALLPAGTRILVSGGDPLRLAGLLAREASGATAILSFGIAGGLHESLAPGDLVSATRVRGPRDAWPADTAWSAAIARVTGARLGMIAGAAAVVGRPAAKRALHEGTAGALAVDLESETAAAFAATHGLPFAALRAVADTVHDTLPHAAAVGLTPEGRPALGRVMLALLRRPGELPALLTVARRARVALAALGGCVGAVAGPRGQPGP